MLFPLFPLASILFHSNLISFLLFFLFCVFYMTRSRKALILQTRLNQGFAFGYPISTCFLETVLIYLKVATSSKFISKWAVIHMHPSWMYLGMCPSSLKV